MARIRFVFFDAGGTLVDLEYRYLREVLDARRDDVGPAGDRAVTLGARAQPDDADFERGERDARAWFIGHVKQGGAPADAWNGYFERVYAGAGVPEGELSALLPALWQRNVADGLWHRPVPGAAATLTSLRNQGLRLAVISNAEGRVAMDLEAAGLAKYFETIVDSHHVGVSKPDPRIFGIAMERLSATAAESVYVGDLYGIDVNGARAAGLSAVLLDRWQLQSEVDCPRIERLSELEGVLHSVL